MAFQRAINKSIAVDQENIGEVIRSQKGFKNNLNSGRKNSNGSKQVFGEIKNVIHNKIKTPLEDKKLSEKKSPFNVINIKSLHNINKSEQKTVFKTPLVAKEKPKISKKSYSFIKNPVRESSDPLCLWAQKIIHTDKEIDHILNGKDDNFEVHIPQQIDDEICTIKETKPPNPYDFEIVPTEAPEFLPDDFCKMNFLRN